MAQKFHISVHPGLDFSSNAVDQKTIPKTFGQLEDSIEVHIYDQNENLIQSIDNFTDYEKIPGDIHSLKIDPEKILNDVGFLSGRYVLKLNFQRAKVFKVIEGDVNPFVIKEISNSRKEIRTTTPNIENALLDPAISSFITELETSAYFKEFVLNFGQDKNVIGINLLLNQNPDKHEVFFKLYAPLPADINNYSSFKIVENIIDPVSIKIDLGSFQTVNLGIPLRKPNFKIDVEQIAVSLQIGKHMMIY